MRLLVRARKSARTSSGPVFHRQWIGRRVVRVAFGSANLVLAALLAVAAPAVETTGGGRSSEAGTASAAVLPATASGVLHEVEGARGSVVLVNVWATWCIPCREEFPDLLRLQRDLAGKGLRLILVSADFASQRPEVEAFLGRQGVGFPSFVKAQGDQEFIEGLEERWSGALPASLLFDRHGKRVAFWEGASTYAELLAKVRPLLEGK
ncbi:MAG: TlpA disulfide reductase family protein [Thermoanaerobaculaceae bacterium]